MAAVSLRRRSEVRKLTVTSAIPQNWPYSLLEALSPRTEASAPPRRRARAPGGADPPPSSLEAGLFLRNFSEDSTPTEIVAAFKQAEHRELQAIKELR